jgi:hypothetical protein
MIPYLVNWGVPVWATGICSLEGHWTWHFTTLFTIHLNSTQTCRYPVNTNVCFSKSLAADTQAEESRFDDPSNQHSALSTSKQHWLTVTCLLGELQVALFCQWITWQFFPPLVFWVVLWPLQACYSMLPRLEVKWRPHNSAAFFCPSWGMLRHTKVAPSIIETWRCNGFH